VNKVLGEIGCGEKPILKVLNKVDVVRKIGDLEMLQTLFPDAVCISAKTGFGLEHLSAAVSAKYRGGEILLRVCSSQSNGKVQSFLRAYGQVLEEQYCDGSVIIDVKLGRNQLPGLQRLHPHSLEIVS
jgi:GTP-binding protein HflX